MFFNILAFVLVITATSCNRATCEEGCVEKPDTSSASTMSNAAPVTPTTTTAPTSQPASTAQPAATTPATTTTVVTPATPACTAEGQINCIVDGVNFKAVKPDNINPWDIRIGQSVAGVSGKLKVNCRNKIKSSIINYDGDPAYIQTAFPFTGGTSLDAWDTIDEDGSPTETPDGWEDNMCEGMEVTNNDGNVWKDITTSAEGRASSCDVDSSRCTRKDKITNLAWTPYFSARTWAQAWDYCNKLSYNGMTGWRLPTVKEIMEGMTHGMVSTWQPNGVTWSGTTVRSMPTQAWRVYMSQGQTASALKTLTNTFMCVR